MAESRRVSTARVRALLAKDLEELRRTPAVLWPLLLLLGITLAIPFGLAIVLPHAAGGELTEIARLTAAADRAIQTLPSLMPLGPAARAQAFVLQQFLLLQLVVPVVGAMAFATHSIVGEKQGRTLEPILATPITATELLVAKTASALLPAMALTLLSLAGYTLGALWLAEPGVLGAVLIPRTFVVYLGLGPLATLAALLLGVIASSRARDARSAQQAGVLVVLPLTMTFVSQMVGAFLLGSGALALMALVLVVVNIGLMWIGIRLFDRERMLTTWR